MPTDPGHTPEIKPEIKDRMIAFKVTASEEKEGDARWLASGIENRSDYLRLLYTKGSVRVLVQPVVVAR